MPFVIGLLLIACSEKSEKYSTDEYLFKECDGGCRESANVYFGNVDDKDPCFDNQTDMCCEN